MNSTLVLDRWRERLREFAKRARTCFHEAVRPKSVALGFSRDLIRTRRELLAENAALRQQLLVLLRRVVKPKLRTFDRLILVAVAALTSTWRVALLIVNPETVLRWHRQGFRLFWQRKSRKTRMAPRLSAEVVGLICRMARDNSTWGAELIRGELLKLGIAVSKRTIQRYGAMMRKPGNGQRWTTFLKNHTVWACDNVQAYDRWFCPIFAFFIVNLNDKRVVHVGVTRSPSAEWTAKQPREATPFG